jgi:hypothetical protein
MIGGAGLTVAQGATLTVPAGTVVKTTSRGERVVDGGSLIANGTSGSPIVFTSSHDSSVGGATDTSQDQPHVRRLGRVVGRRCGQPVGHQDDHQVCRNRARASQWQWY